MRAAPIVFVVVFVVRVTCGLHAQADVVQKTRLDPDYQQGKAALFAGRYADAKHFFELAETRIGTNSAELNAGLALTELQMSNYAAARQHETAVLGLVTDNHARAEAYNIIGSAWVREAGQTGSIDQLHAAEQSFRDASKADPEFAAPYYDLGELLLHQDRGSEAAAAFKDFVRVSVDDPTLIRDMPVQRLGRAPDFSAVDNTGRAISVASLRGRMVLLDFWATWCPPCLRALPVMRELSRYLPSDQLSLISIDEDSPDAQVWKQFISKRNMDWTQVWDKEATVYRTFGLGAPTELSLPRYILIDREGYVLRIYNGTDRLGSVAGHAIRLAQSAQQPDHANTR
ncbi:MAG TPA: redoxin domain-containing protein [Terriglobales bacterium]|nr:redoxin domain-containing protein [Terriglobales bacterium]